MRDLSESISFHGVVCQILRGSCRGLVQPSNVVKDHDCNSWVQARYIQLMGRYKVVLNRPRAMSLFRHRHPHSGVRGRQPCRMVRGQLPGLREGQDAAAGNGFDHPAADQVREIHALTDRFRTLLQFRRDQFHAREVSPISPHITGEDGASDDVRMRADE
jgi:hypothetical protein